MAFNTQDSQSALMSWGRPYMGVISLSGPAFNEGDRLQFLWLSRGVETVTGVVSGNFGLGGRGGFVPMSWPG